MLFAFLLAHPLIANAFDASHYLNDELVPIETPFRFVPGDWRAKLTIFTEVNETKGSTTSHSTTTTESNISASIVSDIVTYTQEITRVARDSKEFGTYDISEPNLDVITYVSKIDGTLIHGEFNHSSRLLDRLDDEAPKTARIYRDMVMKGVRKGELNYFIKDTFGYLDTSIELGASMGQLTTPIDVPGIWNMCKTTARGWDVKVVGATADTVIGGFSWRDSSKRNCEVSATYVKIVDRLSGKPLFQKFEISAEKGDKRASALATSEYVYSPSQDSSASSPTQLPAMLPTGPSLERCSAAPRRAQQVAYPEESLANREEGTVVLRVVPSKSGRVQFVALEESSGFPRLDEWAASDAHAWIFDAEACAGIPMLIPVEYKLPNQ